MKPAYKRFWRIFFLSLAAGVWWAGGGRAWVRRRFYPPPPERPRTQTHFVALLFPKITKGAEPFTLGQGEFEEILKGLKSLGYASIGFDDVAALYREHRPVPARAVLLALDRDEPQSVALAESSLRKIRLRGSIFLTGGQGRKGRYKRHWLSRHEIGQLSEGGAWDFGSAASNDPARPGQEFVFSASSEEFRFTAARTGFNDDRQDLGALNILRVRPGRPVQETLLQIHADQPRRGEFVDEFGAGRLEREWVAGWGAVSTAHRRLVLLPTPRQTGASVFLTGTDGWRDMALEFGLERFRRSFWAYARYQDSGHFVRVGASEGYWVVQQKIGALAAPSLLGRVPMRAGGLPAKVRLVVKGDSALLYLDGAMQFGKALSLNPAVDRGRIQLGVFDQEPNAALAALSFVRARPLGRKWIALKSAEVSSPQLIDRLREEIVEAGVISPRWLMVEENGTVSSLGRSRELVWSFAGYYRCKLVPLADMTAFGAHLGGGGAAERTLEEALSQRAKALEGGGLNLLLTASQEKKAGRFLKELRGRLHAQKGELWITLDGVPDPSLAGAVDGMLRPSGRPTPGLEILEKVEPSALAAPPPARPRPAGRPEAAGQEVALWR